MRNGDYMEKEKTMSIDKSTKQDLSYAFLGAIRRYYSDPANLAKFEEWKKKKEGENRESN